MAPRLAGEWSSETTVGAERVRERFHSKLAFEYMAESGGLGSSEELQTRERATGAFLRQRVGRGEALDATGTLRGDWFERLADEQNPLLSATLGAGWRPGGGPVRLRGAVGRTEQPPLFSASLFSAGPGTAPAPERIRDAEAGVDASLLPRRLALALNLLGSST